MNWLLFCLLVFANLVIFYQDVTTRSVVWYLFPAVAAIGVLHAYGELHSWQNVLVQTGINMGMLLLQVVLLKLYFILKKQRGGFIDNQIGIGDILFLIACCGYFSPINFLFFYCTGLLFSLFLHLVINLVSKGYKQEGSVPLAGYLALFMIFFIGICYIYQTDFTNDDWLLKHLTPA